MVELIRTNQKANREAAFLQSGRISRFNRRSLIGSWSSRERPRISYGAAVSVFINCAHAEEIVVF